MRFFFAGYIIGTFVIIFSEWIGGPIFAPSGCVFVTLPNNSNADES